MRIIISFILLLIGSTLVHAQDAATSEGEKAIERRSRFYEGSPLKKLSSKTSSFTIGGKKFSNASPAIYDGIIYAGTDSGEIVTLTPENKITYKMESGGEIQGAPVVTKDIIYVGFTNNLFAAFSREDGKLLWKYETKGPVTSTPLLHEKRVYFTTSNGFCYSLDAETGAFKWKFSVLSKAFSPLYDKGTAFEKDMVIVGTDRHQVYALNAKNGDQIWVNDGAGGQPLLNDLRVFAAAKGGSVFALDKNTGRPDWHFNGYLTSGTTDFALANNTLVFGNANNLIALDSRSGEGFKWQKDLSQPLASSPIIVGDVVYASCSDGKLYAFDLLTGNEYSHLDLGFTPRSSPAFCKDKIVCANGSQMIFIGGE